jgi:hypothetical protein
MQSSDPVQRFAAPDGDRCRASTGHCDAQGARPCPADRRFGRRISRSVTSAFGGAWLVALSAMVGSAWAVVEPEPAPATTTIQAPNQVATIGGGVFYNWYSGRVNELPDYDTLTPSGYGVAAGFSIDELPQSDDFVVLFSGLLSLGEPGEYRFYTRSDDGSELFLDGVRIVDNDGRHGMRTRWSEPVQLASGDYPIEVGFFEATGSQGLEVGYEGPDGETRVIDPGLLSFPADQMPEPAPAETVQQDLIPGVAYRWFEGRRDALPDFSTLAPDFVGVVDEIDSGVSLSGRNFALRFQAYLLVPEDGIYTFYSRSDDGSAVYIGDRRVVDNDGKHGPRERAGGVALAAGLHRLTVDYFQGGGGDLLEIAWSGPGFTRSPIPAEALSFGFHMLPPMQQPVVPEEDPLPGLVYRYAEGNWHSPPDMDAVEILEYGVVAEPGLERRMDDDRYAFSFDGFVEVSEDGVHNFTVASNSPARLWIGAGEDEQLVAELDRHRQGQNAVGALPMAAGLHPIRIEYFERWGGDVLSLSIQGPSDDSPLPLPADALFHVPSQLPDYLEAGTPVGELLDGLAYTYFEGSWRRLDEMQPEQAHAWGIIDGFSLEPRERDNQFGFVYDGWINIEQSDIYRFFTNSDDGSKLFIGGVEVVDNDGVHGPRDAWGSIGLAAGWHRIQVAFFERGSGEQLEVRYASAGEEPTAIPSDLIGHTADQLPGLIQAVAEPEGRRDGLAYAFAEGNFDEIPNFDELTPTVHGVSDGLDLGVSPADSKFALRYSGYIEVPESGFYRFYGVADDGLALRIAGQEILVGSRNREAYGSIGLEQGFHPFELVFRERWGAEALQLRWRLPNGDLAEVPAPALTHTPDDLPTLRPADVVTDPKAGLAYRQYDGQWSSLPDFSTLAPTAMGVIDTLALSRLTRPHKVGARFEGYLAIPESGFYRLHLNSDDGSKLWVGDELVIDNDGRHGPREKLGSIGLDAGLHAIRIDYFQRWGDMTLGLEVTEPDGTRRGVTAADLVHRSDQLPALRDPVADPDQLPVTNAINGLAYELYLGSFGELPDFSTLTSDGVGIASVPDLAGIGLTDKFALRYQGWLRIDEAGWYDVWLGSNDGSRLLIGGDVIVDNDGRHSYREVAGSVGLDAGWHAIEVQFFEYRGTEELSVELRGPDGLRGAVPADALVLDAAALPDLQDADADPANLTNQLGGVEYAYYEGRWRSLPDFDQLTPVATGVVGEFTLAPRTRDDNYGFVFDAYVDIPEYGFYEFCTRSDDGSQLFIGGVMVVDNDGLHSARTRAAVASGWTAAVTRSA